MNALGHLRLQMGLEGIGLAGEQKLRHVQDVPGEEMPLLLLARLADSRLVAYYAESLSADLQAQLRQCFLSIAFPDIEPVLNALALHNIQAETAHYKTYLFPPRTATDPEVTCLSQHDPKIQALGFDGFAEQIYGIKRGGRVVSACVSVREDQNCGEAWVYTDPAYRRRGFAQKVVGAWAHGLAGMGKIPFYSHKIDNLPSAKLAEALQLQPVFEEITVTENSG